MKRGRPAHTRQSTLRFFERRWFYIFKGMRDGGPPRERLRRRVRTKFSNIPELASEQMTLEDERQEREDEREPTDEDFIPIPPVPPEKDVWEKLKRAETIVEVREACQQSKYWLNPKVGGRGFLRHLSDQAAQFLKSKKDARYPRSNRPLSDSKRLLYLARVMAGITCQVSFRSAVDRLEKERIARLKAEGSPKGSFPPV